MTFLELVQRLRQEAGIAGTGPTNVESQTGELKRLVDWTASAWNDIQRAADDWAWMRDEFTLTLVPGQEAYTATEAGITDRFSHWYPRSTRLRLTGPQDETLLSPISYDEFRSVYMTGPNPLSRPVAVSVWPDMKIAFGYTPNLAYTVRGEYQKSLQHLTVNSDVPEMPEQFHEAIFYRALMKYARYMAAGEIYQDAYEMYRTMMNQLRVHQMPSVTTAGALA